MMREYQENPGVSLEDGEKLDRFESGNVISRANQMVSGFRGVILAAMASVTLASCDHGDEDSNNSFSQETYELSEGLPDVTISPLSVMVKPGMKSFVISGIADNKGKIQFSIVRNGEEKLSDEEEIEGEGFVQKSLDLGDYVLEVGDKIIVQGKTFPVAERMEY